MNSMDQVTDRVYLGNIFSPRNASALREADVSHVLSITNDSIVLPSTLVPPLIHKKIGIDDYADEDLLIHLKEGIDFIEEALSAGRSVLVHCVQGASRSASFVAAYLMKKNEWSRDETIAFLKSKRPIVKPNDGFMEQLDVYSQARYDITAESPEYQEWLKRNAAAFQEKLQNMS